MRVSNRLQHRLSGFADLLEKYAPYLVAAFLLLYFVCTWRIIVHRPLWLDEITTFDMARLQPGEMLRALRVSADMQPPLFELLNYPFARVGGPEMVRIPALLGIGAMVLCLYLFVSREKSRIHGMLAMVFCFCTFAGNYGYEARPYAIVLGGSAAALLCWQRLRSGTHYAVWLGGLWLCCTLVTGIHYYGLLSLIPLAAGEVVRWFEAKRVDFRVPAVLASSLLPIFLAYPIVHAVRSVGMHNWAKPAGHTPRDLYETLLSPALLPVSLCLIAILLASTVLRRTVDDPALERSQRTFRPDSMVAIAGFAALPILGIVLSFFTGAISARYVLGGVVGFCAAFAWALPRRKELAAIALTVTGLYACAVLLQQARKHDPTPQVPPAALTSEQLPVLYAGMHELIATQFYAPPAIRERMYYLTSPAIALRRTGQNSLEYFIQGLGTICGCNIVPYADFMAIHRHFIVVTQRTNQSTWLLDELSSAGAALRLISIGDGAMVYDAVSRGSDAPAQR